jgi:sugar lactone lactonase YvrE
VGYSGVTVWTPEGTLIGRIRLPEVCDNICFGHAGRLARLNLATTTQ